MTPLISKLPIYSFVEGLIVYLGNENEMKDGRVKWVTESGVNSITIGKEQNFIFSIYTIWGLRIVVNLG
jgi:hypothetical protein